jgi:hypothetical protein
MQSWGNIFVFCEGVSYGMVHLHRPQCYISQWHFVWSRVPTMWMQWPSLVMGTNWELVAGVMITKYKCLHLWYKTSFFVSSWHYAHTGCVNDGCSQSSTAQTGFAASTSVCLMGCILQCWVDLDTFWAYCLLIAMLKHEQLCVTIEMFHICIEQNKNSLCELPQCHSFVYLAIACYQCAPL